MTGSGLIKVLMITSRADFGGGPEHIFRLLNSLNDKIDFYVACPEDYPYWGMYTKLLGPERLLKIPHRKFSLGPLREMARFCRKNKIRIVHSHGKGAGIYSRILSFKWGLHSVHTFHGIHTGAYTPLEKTFYMWLEKFLSLATTKFISVSVGEMKIAAGSGIAPISKIVLIPNGTPIPEKTAAYSFGNSITPEIATITRFDLAKNTELLIPIAEELLKQINNFRFIVIGSGELYEEFRNKIILKNLDSYFRLTGSVLNTGDYLINSFCYISTSRWEGLPLGVLEAMSYALPVVATNVTGNNDLIVDNINGCLYDINKPVEAAGCILKLLDNESLYRSFAVNARKKVIENYNLTSMAEKTFNLYSGLKDN